MAQIFQRISYQVTLSAASFMHTEMCRFALYVVLVTCFTLCNVRCEDESLAAVVKYLQTQIIEMQAEMKDLRGTIATQKSTAVDRNQAALQACESDPCLNNGTCIEVSDVTFVCACRDGFYGLTCEQSDAESVFFACFGVEWENETPDEEVILWDTVRINIGGNYDIATGAYTAPQDGIYQFQVQKYSNNNASQFWFIVNDVRYSYTWHVDPDTPSRQMTGVTTIQLNAGDTVQVMNDASNITYGIDPNGIRSWFTGHLLYPL